MMLKKGDRMVMVRASLSEEQNVPSIEVTDGLIVEQANKNGVTILGIRYPADKPPMFKSRSVFQLFVPDRDDSVKQALAEAERWLEERRQFILYSLTQRKMQFSSKMTPTIRHQSALDAPNGGACG